MGSAMSQGHGPLSKCIPNYHKFLEVAQTSLQGVDSTDRALETWGHHVERVQRPVLSPYAQPLSHHLVLVVTFSFSAPVSLKRSQVNLVILQTEDWDYLSIVIQPLHHSASGIALRSLYMLQLIFYINVFVQNCAQLAHSSGVCRDFPHLPQVQLGV